MDPTSPKAPRPYTTVTVSTTLHTRLCDVRKQLRALGGRLPDDVRDRLEAAARTADDRERGTQGLAVIIDVALDALVASLEPLPPPLGGNSPPAVVPQDPPPDDFDRYPITGQPGSMRSIASLDAEHESAALAQQLARPVHVGGFDHSAKPDDAPVFRASVASAEVNVVGWMEEIPASPNPRDRKPLDAFKRPASKPRKKGKKR